MTPQEIQALQQRFCIAYGRAIERVVREGEAHLYDLSSYVVVAAPDLAAQLSAIYPFTPPKHSVVPDASVPGGKIEFAFPKRTPGA